MHFFPASGPAYSGSGSISAMGSTSFGNVSLRPREAVPPVALLVIRRDVFDVQRLSA